METKDYLGCVALGIAVFAAIEIVSSITKRNEAVANRNNAIADRIRRK